MRSVASCLNPVVDTTQTRSRQTSTKTTWWPQRDFHFVGVLGADEHGGVGAARPKAIAATPRRAEGLTRDAAPAEETLQYEASLGSAGAEHATHIASQGLQARREPRAVERDRARPRVERRELPVERLCLLLLSRKLGEQGVRRLPALHGVEQVPTRRGDGRALPLQGRALGRDLGAAPLQALQGEGDGAGHHLLVEGLGQGVEEHTVKA